jgi:hypothetical protein
MSKTQIIIGAGLAGLIAACHFKDAFIYEAGSEVSQHKALLRFRTRNVSELTGIPFKDVKVHKGIWTHSDKRLHTSCDIRMANQYSQKVSNGLRGRSIWNLEPVTRYVAPDDFHAQLVDRHRARIAYNSPINYIPKIQYKDDVVHINTAPLHVIATATSLDLEAQLSAKSDRAAIRVDRYQLPPGTNVYQTIYYPEPDLRVFRASITGDVMIVESIDGYSEADKYMLSLIESELDFVVCESFGISKRSLTFIETVDQKYGKIVDMPENLRRAAIYSLTRDYGVYSLGRFATWKNILLDDVVDDIKVIDKLIKAGDYGALHYHATQTTKFDDDIPF